MKTKTHTIILSTTVKTLFCTLAVFSFFALSGCGETPRERTSAERLKAITENQPVSTESVATPPKTASVVQASDIPAAK